MTRTSPHPHWDRIYVALDEASQVIAVIVAFLAVLAILTAAGVLLGCVIHNSLTGVAL